MPATLTSDEKRRTRFGQALSEAMHTQGLTQAELGARLNEMRQSSISAWTTGAALPPDVETVFALERALKLTPGQLSKHLGFLPTRRSKTVLTVADAVKADDRLDDAGQRVLLATYKELVNAAKRRHPTAHQAALVRPRRHVA